MCAYHGRLLVAVGHPDNKLSGLLKALFPPLAISLGHFLGLHRDNFRDVVGMLFLDHGGERFELLGRALDQHKDLVGLRDLALPAVMRFEAGDEIHAGGEMLLEQRAREATGLLKAGGGDQDEARRKGHGIM
jgi:hypothetical protein